mgnify:CR=1 FL=1
MRGEHLPPSSSPRTPKGSSPRARGAPRARRTRELDEGIIPACAGSTIDAKHLKETARGSSPRARGALRIVVLDGTREGIIPACAGSTENSIGWPFQTRDHPRVRGEHPFFTKSSTKRTGSSPRARGALGQIGEGETRRGIIPACAGSTPSPACSAGPPWDHPRVRGEHGWTRTRRSSCGGSSPRARGALAQTTPATAKPGIIPACAGSTPV